MLHSVSELESYQVTASDGSMGTIQDGYFDDHAWVVRYLIVDTGAWLPGRKVLLSPLSMGRIDAVRHNLPVSLDRDAIKNGPGIDAPYLEAQAEDARVEAPAPRQREQDDAPHLRSCHEVAEYHVHGSDGELGRVEGFLVDERGWIIRYLIVNTGHWWLGHQVLIAPEWIGEVSWPNQTVTTGLSRQQIRLSPPYHPGVPLERDLEAGLYAHYGETGYWASAAARCTRTIEPTWRSE